MKSRLARGGHILQDMPPLLAQGRHDGQQAFDKVTAGTTLGPKAPLAPQYDGTQGSLGRVIGKLDTLIVNKIP